MDALTKAGIKGSYVIGGWNWGGAFAANHPNKTKGLLLVDPASKEGYEQMAIQYPDVFTLIFQERVDNNQADKEVFDDMAATMYQASSYFWLKFFNYGPLEWIWRQLTYGKRLRLRKH